MKNPIRSFGKVALLGILLLTSLSALPARQDPPTEAEKTRAWIQALSAWIENLGSDRPEDREAAMEGIRKAGAAAVPLLKEALAKTQEAETRARLDLLLSELDLPDPSTFFQYRRNNPGHPLGGTEAGKAVHAALRWLALHQNPDGSWGADRFAGRCSGDKCTGPGERDYDIGVSALAILAFLGAGYTPDSAEELPDPTNKRPALTIGETVRSGLKWLISRQDIEGCVGDRGMKFVYDHAIATLALAEAWGMAQADFLKVPAQKATDFLVACRNPGKAWRYSSKCGDNDCSVSGWALLALKTAEFSSLKVPKASFTDVLVWFDEVTEVNGDFQVGYNARATGKVYIPGQNENFHHHPTMSAIGATARLFIQRRRTELVQGEARLVFADLPQWKENAIDFYYWYHGSLLVFQYNGPEGPLWNQWREALLRALTPNQKSIREGCQEGSWDPSVDRWGLQGGRVFATALNALTLETSRRHPVVCDFQSPARR